MREQEVYGLINQVKGGLQQVVQFIQNFQQAIRLDSTGKEIRLLGLQRLLIKKGIITEAEMTEMSGEVIKEMQAQAEKAAQEAAAPAVVTPTPEQVQQVTNAPAAEVEAAIKEQTPPQA